MDQSDDLKNEWRVMGNIGLMAYFKESRISQNYRAFKNSCQIYLKPVIRDIGNADGEFRSDFLLYLGYAGRYLNKDADPKECLGGRGSGRNV